MLKITEQNLFNAIKSMIYFTNRGYSFTVSLINDKYEIVVKDYNE